MDGCLLQQQLDRVVGLDHSGWMSATAATRPVIGLDHSGWMSATAATRPVVGLDHSGWMSATASLLYKASASSATVRCGTC